MCGGTPALGLGVGYIMGLSPRVRGNPIAAADEVKAGRSIPACAGEPSSDILYPAALKVYPRVCGGTSLLTIYE